MNLYLCNKIYDTRYGDLVPIVIANALNVNVLIISEGTQGFETEVVYTNAGNDNMGEILIYKSLDHYDGITQMSKSPKYLVGCSNINEKSDITGGPSPNRYQLSEDGAPESKESKTASCFAVRHGDRGPTIGHVGTEMVNPSGDSEKIIGQFPSTISAASVNISRDTALQDSSDSVNVLLTDTDGKPVEDYSTYII